MSDITRNNIKGQLALIWNALECYREECIPEMDDEKWPDESKMYNEEWDDICTAMAWITEDLESLHQTKLSDNEDE